MSGYRFEGDWHHFPATAVGPHHFLAAAHTGGLPLQAFRYHGVDYYSLDRTIIPGTDLALWRIAGTFPEWAEMYDGSSEVGKDIVLYGRGGPRGAAVMAQGQRRGWWWSDSDGRLTWGRNRITGISTPVISDAGYGPVLTFQFSPQASGAGEDTASVSGGDSGGGVFLHDTDGKWKLCGVIYGVDNNYRLSPTDKESMAAALYDVRGLYRVTSLGLYYINPGMPDPIAATGLVSRISPFVPGMRIMMSRPPRWRLYAASAGAVLCIALAIVAGIALFRRRLIHLWWMRKQKRLPGSESAGAEESAEDRDEISAANTLR